MGWYRSYENEGFGTHAEVTELQTDCGNIMGKAHYLPPTDPHILLHVVQYHSLLVNFPDVLATLLLRLA